MSEAREPLDPTQPLPALRPLEAVPIDHEGEKRVVLRDLLDVAPGVLVVPIPVYYLTAQLDGESSIRDLQADFVSRFGQRVTTEDLELLVRQLDEAYLLDTPRFRRRLEEVKETFFKDPIRPPFHAGTAYPEDPSEARVAFTGFFEPPRGPGALGTLAGQEEATAVRPDSTGDAMPGSQVCAVFSPHYDLRRGGPMLARAFRPIVERGPVERVVVFGTNHQPDAPLFTLTRKAFATPFGTVEADHEFLDALEEAHPEPGPLYDEEFGHRREHSVEFQVVMLAHVSRELQWDPVPRVVPVLVGSFHELYGGPPTDDARVQAFLSSLGQAERICPGQTLLVASGDLAHVGPRFGDDDPLDEPFLRAVREDDRALMDRMIRGGADAFHAHLAGHQDRRRICGHSCAYTMLKAAEEVTGGALEGTVLGYDMAVDPDGAVSYGSLAFYPGRD